jgi:hypothetical protein
MKSLLVLFIVLCASMSSAQEMEHPKVYKGILSSIMTLQEKGMWHGMSADSLFVSPLGKGELALSGLGERDVRIDLLKKAPHVKTPFESFRKELDSLTSTLPDLSASWWGITGRLRNPLRYKIVPRQSFADELSFQTGKWLLSINGIRSTTLEDLELALFYPFGETMNVVVRSDGVYYVMTFDLSGKLPWE